MKKTALAGIKVRIIKTAPAGATRVGIGPFRELRMKKTALAGIKDHKDRASWTLGWKKDRANWSDTGGDRSL